MNTNIRSFVLTTAWALLGPMALLQALTAHATTSLADQPVFSSKDVPGNMALALSVEFPTAVSVAHVDSNYDGSRTYLGYFDPKKCYLYSFNATEALRHFYPAGLGTSLACTASADARKWSGNFLNWATMQTVDPFRWALTGGYRSIDTATETILEKANATGQGGTGNFPNRVVTSSGTVADNTPFGWSRFSMRIQGLGNKMRFTRNGNIDNTPTAWDGLANDNSTVYEVSVRVKVCDTSAAAGGLESNCVAYPASNYKPIGLMQQYAEVFRFSAFGYLNDDNMQRDGGVLRARQKFVGMMKPRPTQTPIANPAAEWDANNGVLLLNPDAADASMTNSVFNLSLANAVTNSGVINYLNKFGQLPGNTTFKTFDPVGELYYAALRYYKNLGNVPEWTAVGGASEATRTTWVDGFPVITTWDDPVQYSCQKNFILGIGDVNSHADKNVPGSSTGANEPGKPTSLSTDPVDAVLATNKVGALHGLGTSLGTTYNYNGCCSENSALMAGLAYDANTQDIRPLMPNVPDRQSVQTFWLDILEFQQYKANNQFYLAAKYGGFKVPSGYDMYSQATDIPKAWWSTSGETVGGQDRPDNYFVASDPAAMVAGLRRAFSKAASDLKLYTTSFATALPQLAVIGSSSFAGKYDATNWTGEIEGNSLTFDANLSPVQATQWSFSTKLALQVAGTLWNTDRRMVTWNTSSRTGVAFRWANLSSGQQATLDTVYRSGSDGSDFLNYLRGDTSYEEGSAAAVPAAAKVYRARTSLVGDIVGSRVLPVGPPAQPFAASTNPGYASFASARSTRQTMLYVGTNAGVLHAINGAITGSDAGKEVFAYVPGAMFRGASGVPINDGLQARGDPNFTHRNMVDGPVVSFDIDLGRTVGGSGTAWSTVLVGSFGKGGRGYFAIDISDPSAMTSESAVAAKVLWEINQADASGDFSELGFSFGQPVAVKTLKYGWVLIFASGHNTPSGNAYFFVVNPRNGALLERVQAPVGGTAGSQMGMAHLDAFVLDYSNGTADSAYAGDLKGNLYRLDLTAPTGTAYTVRHLAQVANAAGDPLPITTRPALVLHPRLSKRFIAVGTGRLLSSTDTTDARSQVFAAISDGNGAGFNKSHNTSLPTQVNTLPAGFSFPLQMSSLTEHTDLTLPVVLAPTKPMGWWVDLGATAGNGWRMIRDPSTFNGMVSFISTLPTPDPCSPSGTSRFYSVDVGTGQSELVERTTNVTTNVTTTTRLAYNSSALTGEGISSQSVSIAGRRALIACSNNGGCKRLEDAGSAPTALRRLNWRELLLAD
ncbi:MAG: pilus assembly protein [Rubrivivax sp.]|nr:pilus assembly protein [Rubrivivax sp.]